MIEIEMEIRKGQILKLAIAIFVCLLAGFIGSYSTTGAIDGWYDTLEKPSYTPPSWVFAPVWTLLYILMGVSLFLVWDKGIENPRIRNAMLLFGAQLILNLSWSLVFFGMQNPLYGLVNIIILWAAIVFVIIDFYHIEKKAAYLLIPYILWVTFAAFLNYGIYALN